MGQRKIINFLYADLAMKLWYKSYKPNVSLIIWVLLFIIFFGAPTFAQSLPGSVTSNFISLNGAIIRNITAKKIAVSDVHGSFRINAVNGDTIITSFIGYNTDTLIVKTQNFLAISLRPFINALGEVIIKGNKLSPLEQFKKNKEDYKQIYRIGDNSHLFSAGGGYGHIGVGLSVDALYSTFSKEGKDARRLQRILINDYHSSLVDSRFTKNLVSRITGWYQGKQLDDFMTDNRPTYEFIQTATDYDLIEYIRRRTKGIILQTDNPSPKKTEDRGFKVKFKMPNIQLNNRPSGAMFIPKIRP